MSNSKQEVYKNYILEKFMNAPSNKHLENHDDNLDNMDNSLLEFNNMDDEIQNKIKSKNVDVTFTNLENDTLSNNIEYERDYYKDYRLHLCLYKVDTTLRLPFLKYLVKKEEQYIFPNKLMEMKPMIDSISRNNDEPIDSLFMQQIKVFYQELTSNELITAKYKGYIENEKNDIFVFIDISNMNIETSFDCEFIIMDEILNTGIVRNTSIDKLITELFKANVFLQTLRTEKVLKVQFPKIGYIIQEDKDGNYKNVISTNKAEDILIYPKINHKSYNNTYLFSAIPLSVENIDNLFRFACFIENFDNDQNVTDNIVFEENDVQFYAIKTIDLFKQI